LIKSKKLTIISWVAAFISLVGIFLNAYQIIWCWLVWTISNLFWIYWSYEKKEWAQVVLWVIFTGANLYAWYVWTTFPVG